MSKISSQNENEDCSSDCKEDKCISELDPIDKEDQSQQRRTSSFKNISEIDDPLRRALTKMPSLSSQTEYSVSSAYYSDRLEMDNYKDFTKFASIKDIHYDNTSDGAENTLSESE